MNDQSEAGPPQAGSFAKTKVHIQITSKTQSDPETIQETEGWMYRNEDGAIFLRYEEPDPGMGNTVTIMKWEQQDHSAKPSLQLSRFGDAKVKQTFTSGKQQTTSYMTPYGRMPWTVKTHRITSAFAGESGQIQWSYDGWFADQYAGLFTITLKFSAKT